MNRTILIAVSLMISISGIVRADIFGTGANQFEIGFVTISGNTNPASGINTGNGFLFQGVSNDYRIGTYEITNNQWNKFKAEYGPVKGRDGYNYYDAYDESPEFTGINVPTNNVSWYEATQFVNWLNTSTGHQSAYKFTGTQGTGDYKFAVWNEADTGYNPDNPYRNSNAFYFLPTEDEWVKAGYWNGTTLQPYATKQGDTLYKGDGTNGGWNYFDNITSSSGPWNVGSGSEELNGTFDMMGNVWEWTESKYTWWNTTTNEFTVRGGDYQNSNISLSSYYNRPGHAPYTEDAYMGFRVASVPEPTTLLLLGMGGLLIRKRK